MFIINLNKLRTIQFVYYLWILYSYNSVYIYTRFIYCVRIYIYILQLSFESLYICVDLLSLFYDVYAPINNQNI
jgi:hypothetical protein